MIGLNEIQKLEPSAIIELFVLDASEIDGPTLYFHAGTNNLRQNLVWQGVTYVRYPVQVTGFEFSANGPLPRPRMVVSNFMSGVTALTLSYDDLIGAKVIRKRTLKKFLDAVNFAGGVNPSADDTAYLSDDEFYIDRKVNEGRAAVEFELVSKIDLSNLSLPRRQIIQNACPWKYRGAECGYVGTDYFTINDEPTGDVNQDFCAKRLNSCKLRFGENEPLPYGGFPGADLVNGGRG
jgi:lambda family phage minor tail protein L